MYPEHDNTRAEKLIRQAGFSLLELTLVVLILGIMAATVIPNFSSTEPAKLDLAAQEFADAIRFARSEAIRQGKPHGFRQVSSLKLIKVFRADTGSVPWTPVYDVYHPISKKLYQIDINTHPFAKVDSMLVNRTYKGTCSQASKIYFDATGIARCINPSTVLLDRWDATFTLGSYSRVISLNSVTGQVSIQ